MRKRLLFGLAGLLAVAGIAAGIAEAKPKASTKVTMANAIWFGGDAQFDGEMTSPKEKCRTPKVTLYRIDGGSEVKVGSDRASGGLGIAWAVNLGPDAVPGDYIAKVPKTKRCKADASDVKTLGPKP